MALNRQNQQNIQDTATYVEDTLRSVAANIGEALKEAVDNAFDSKDATVLSSVGKDFVRSMISAARASEDLVKNQSRIAQGLLSSRDIEKQMQSVAEKRLELNRRFEYITTLARDAKREITDSEKEAYKQASLAIQVQEEMLAADKEHLGNVEKTIGLTGKLVSALGKVPGIGKFIDAKKIEQEMKIVANETNSKFRTMGVAASMVGKQLLEGLLDPLAFITLIWNGFMKVDKAATDFTRTTGQGTSAISSMNSNLASTVDILEVATNLSKELGISGSNFISPQQLAAVAETKNLLGLSAEQATKLAIQTKISGQNVGTFKSNVMAGVKQSNLQNKSGVEYGVVIKDILNTSEDVTMSLGNNPKKLAAAATAARAFGLTLQQVDDIANSLMNFEDSIGAELEAQLLTGKNINLSKARELALNNDLEGVANELAKNGASAAEFSQMNRIQQEGLAKALGMSREQLAKSVLAQEASKNLTDKQRAAIMGMSEAEYERVSIQERIQTSLDKIAQAFAPILEKFVVPIVEGLTKLMNLPLVPYILAGVVAINSLGGGVLKVVSGMGSLAKGALDFVKNLNMAGVSKFLTKIKDSFKQGATGMGASSPWSPQQQPAAPAQRGGGMSSVANSIQKINPTKLLAGAAALAIAAGAMFILGKAMQQFQGIGVETYLGAGAALLGLTLALAGLSMLSGPVLVGAAALLVGAAAIFVLGKALQEVGKALPIMAEGMGMIFPMLTGLAQAIGPILLLGPALFGIAAGLSAVSLAGLMALPAIGGLLLLSKAAPALVSLGIGGEKKSAGQAKGKSEEGGMAALEAKFDTLIELVRQGTTINLDGSKIATSVNRNLPKVQTVTT